MVVGASFAGLSIAHHFLDQTIERLKARNSTQAYRLVLVSPSTHIYWNIGAPRTLVAGNLIEEPEAFVAIEPGFDRHQGADWTFVQAICVKWTPEQNEIIVEPIGALAQKRCSQVMVKRKSGSVTSPKTPSSANGSLSSQQAIPYHALILATGTSADSELLSLHGPHTRTIGALKDFHKAIPKATSITVCGGGPSGVETAGQLATYLNHQSLMPSFLSGAQQQNLLGLKKCPRKAITLITSSSRLLPNLKPKIGYKAEVMLAELGVNVIKNVRVMSTSPSTSSKESGKTRVELSDNRVLLTDLYIPATGVSPNTSYAPSSLTDSGGYIVTDAKTLRVPNAGERVYAIGDCASYSSNYVLDVYVAVSPLMHNLCNDLRVAELRKANPYPGNVNEPEIEGMKDEILNRDEVIKGQLCPITRRGGVGVLMGLGLPSLLVYLAKGRDYRVGKGKKVVVDGNNPY